MLTRQKTQSKKKQPDAPVAYDISVNVDIDGKFTYSAPGHADASHIRPHNNDTISWSVTLRGIPCPFQIEFPAFSPFDSGERVLRSMYRKTDPRTVNVPDYYHGNLVFKYTVSIANAWSDDPDVEPVVSDGIANMAGPQVIGLSIADGKLVLNPSDPTFDPGEVDWQWSGTKLDEFTLKLDSPPPPTVWPQVTASQSKRIALDLGTSAGQARAYTIQTANLGLSGDGTIAIR